MFKLDYNPIVTYWNERMAKLSKEQIDLMNLPIGKINLFKLKKSKDKIHTGDIFVLSPIEGIYLFGKVLEANIKHATDNLINGGHVVFIFRNKSTKKDLINYAPDYNNLLLFPSIVTSGYWEKGYFETIGNIPLTQEERNLDYGFFEMEPLNRWGNFKKANGELLNHFPKIISNYGVKVYAGIFMTIRTESILDPNLLGGILNNNCLSNEEEENDESRFNKKIVPFFLTEQGGTTSVCLKVGEYCKEVFETRSEEGFLGNGYDWEALALVFLNEKMPELINSIEFDSEAGMFCVYSVDKEALKKFIVSFKKICEDEKNIYDLFSRTELL